MESLPHRGTGSAPLPGSAGTFPPGRPRWKRILDRVLLGMLVLFAASQIWLWWLWDNPSMGDSLRYLIAEAQLILSALCVIVWWFWLAPARLSTRLLVGTPVLLLIAGWLASIRSVQFTGDMRLIFDYRWNPSRQEVLKKSVGQLTRVAVIDSLPTLTPEDSPAYRGIHRDGHVIGPALSQSWGDQTTPELWRRPCGGGYASYAIIEPLMVTIEQRDNDEAVVCYDTRTGGEYWVHRYPAFFSEAMGGIGPRSTPTIDGDRVYSWGAFGDLFCLDLQTGKVHWHVNSLQQFRVPNTHWGMTSSPLIDSDQVVVNIGGLSGPGLIAYAKSTGELKAFSSDLTPQSPELASYVTGSDAVAGLPGFSVPGYSSPELRTVLGEEVILNFDGTGLRGHQRVSLEELFFFPWKNGANVNVGQPIVIDNDQIFISVSYDKGCALVQVAREGKEWTTSEVWGNNQLRCKFTSPVFHDGYFYGLDEGILVCLDPATGKRKWKGGRDGLKGRYYHGQLLVSNGQIIASTEDGQLVLVQPSPDKLIEVTRMRVLPDGKNWNPPVLVRGKIYVRNAEEMACFNLSAEQ